MDDKLTIAEGYSLYNEEDARQLEDERKKIKYLKSKIDLNKPETVRRFYEKALEQKTFMTPAGLCFMSSLREYLVNNPQTKDMDISPIPLYLTYNEGMPGPKAKIPRVKPLPQKKSVAFPCSVILNILLVAAVIAMFLISLNSAQPNIINYEKAIVDKYSAWEEDLSAREAALREKQLQAVKEAD